MKKDEVFFEAKLYKDIREMMNDSYKNYPENIAFIIKKKDKDKVNYINITYRMLENDVLALGTALMHLGLHNAHIAIIAKNRYEWCLTYLTTLCGLGVVVPLDKSLPHGEIENLLQRSNAEAIVFEKEYYNTMKQIKQKETNVKQFISMDEQEDGEFLSFAKILELGRRLLEDGNKEFVNTTINPEEMGIIIFTSGTTALAKAVMLSQKNIVSNIYSMSLVEKILSTDVSLTFLPLHHTFGSTGLLLFLSKGVTNTFCDGLKYIQKNLAEYHISIFVCVPLLLEAMHKRIFKEIEKQGKTKKVEFGLKLSKFLLKFGIDIRRKLFKDILNSLGGNLRFVVSGAAGIDKTVAMHFNEFGVYTIQGYGLTETSPVLIAENSKYIKYGSVGLPMPNVEVKINNPNEQGIGEIIAKGPNVMLGYYKNEEATKEVLQDGWFYTGDLGYMDEEGFFFVSGRKKNVIVMKNGKNIYPEELELLIAKLPYVSENMVFGIPSKEDDLDLAVKIVYNIEYVKENFNNISEEELKQMIWEDIKKINKTMPPYKYIRKLIITDEPMIKTTTQKVKRHDELKKMGY